MIRSLVCWPLAVSLLFIVLSSRGVGGTLHVDTFATSSTMSWGGGEFASATVSVVPTGGPAGDGDGYLEVAQTNNFHLAVRTTSSDWTGSYAAIGAEQISVDMRSAPGSQPLAIRLVLFGPNPGADSNRWVSNTAINLADDGLWQSVTFPLAESEFTHFGAGTFSQLMSGVVRVMFRHDPGTPTFGGVNVTGTLGLDNIALEAAAPPPLAGDYNNDGKVDAADYVVWRNNFGAPAGTLPNDVDGGTIDVAQYTTWKTHYGESREGALEAVGRESVPEPPFFVCTSLLVVGLALAHALWCREPVAQP